MESLHKSRAHPTVYHPNSTSIWLLSKWYKGTWDPMLSLQYVIILPLRECSPISSQTGVCSDAIIPKYNGHPAGTWTWITVRLNPISSGSQIASSTRYDSVRACALYETSTVHRSRLNFWFNKTRCLRGHPKFSLRVGFRVKIHLIAHWEVFAYGCDVFPWVWFSGSYREDPGQTFQL